MQIRPTAFTIGLIIHPSIALFSVYTEFGIDSNDGYIFQLLDTVYDILCYLCCIKKYDRRIPRINISKMQYCI